MNPGPRRGTVLPLSGLAFRLAACPRRAAAALRRAVVVLAATVLGALAPGAGAATGASTPVLPDSDLRGLPQTLLQATGFGQPGCSATQGAWSPDARVLALEMNCVAAGQGRRFWLLDLEHGDAVAASPPLGPPDLQQATASATGADLYWSEQTLLVFTSGYDDTRAPGSPGASLPISFVASLGPVSRTGVVGVSAELKQRRRATAAARQAARALDDPGLLEATALPLGQHLAWLSDQGNGEIILRSRRTGQDDTQDLQRGGWELQHLLPDQSHLIHPSDAGLVMVDLDHGTVRHVQGTAAGDLPLAWNPATRSLAWTSPRPCGLGDDAPGAGLQLCTIVLDPVD